MRGSPESLEGTDIHAALTLAHHGLAGRGWGVVFLLTALSLVLSGSDAQIHKLRLPGCERSAQDREDKGEGPPDLEAPLSECRDCAAPQTLTIGKATIASDFLAASPPKAAAADVPGDPRASLLLALSAMTLAPLATLCRCGFTSLNPIGPSTHHVFWKVGCRGRQSVAQTPCLIPRTLFLGAQCKGPSVFLSHPSHLPFTPSFYRKTEASST